MENGIADKLFRKKSMEKVVSPENLNDYIRVPNPGVWFLLLAILLLFVGFFVWGIFGFLHTTVSVVAVSEEGQLICYISEEDSGSVQVGMNLEIQGQELPIVSIASVPVCCEEMDSYVCHVGNFAKEDWVYEAQVDGMAAGGVYSAQITTERISPMSFLWN